MANDMNGQMCDLAQPTPLPSVTVPAMAYVPFQQFSSIYPVLKEQVQNKNIISFV